MSDKKIRWIFTITAALVMFLFACAFVLSYDALYALAMDNGVNPGLAWLWPLGLDAFMVCASLYMLWSHLVKEYEPLPLAIVMVSMCASVAFNVIHAPVTDLARSIAALPPLVAFMAFEIMVIMVRHAVEQRGVPLTQHDMSPVQRDMLRAHRRAQLATILRAEPSVTRAEAARRLRVSVSTVNRDWLAVNVDAGRNGAEGRKV